MLGQEGIGISGRRNSIFTGRQQRGITVCSCLLGRGRIHLLERRSAKIFKEVGRAYIT